MQHPTPVTPTPPPPSPQHHVTRWWLPPQAPPAWTTSGGLTSIDQLSSAQQFGLLTECKRWASFKDTDDEAILASLRLCTDKNMSLSIKGGGTITLKGVYPPHTRNPLLQPTTSARTVAANSAAYSLRPCLQGTYTDPGSMKEFKNCFADVVCAFARVDSRGTRITPPVLLLQWHETDSGGLERCNSAVPCTLAYLGVRYSVLRLSDAASVVTRMSPVAVVTGPLTGFLTVKQYPSVKVLSLNKPPHTLTPLLAAHMFGGMHTT